MKITLSDRLGEALRRRAEAGGYKTIDDYVQAVIQEDLIRAEGDELGLDPALSEETRMAIQKGLESGLGLIADEAFWAERDRKLAERHART